MSGKHPGGRPSTYDPAFADQIVDLMAEGLSLTSAAATLGFWRQRAYEWAEKHPELADALKYGQAMRTLKLERDLLKADAGPVVAARIFALKNAAPQEFRDRVVQEHSGPEGGPIQTEDVTKRDADEFARRIVRLAAAENASGGTGEAEPEGKG